MKKHAWMLLALLAVPHLALAYDNNMVRIDSTYPNGYVGNLNSSLEDDARGRILDFSYTDTLGTHLNYKVDDLRKGVVLFHALNKDLISVSGPGFDEQVGGPLILTFYRKFLSGNDRRQARFEYVRAAEDGSWLARTNDAAGREKFDRIFIKMAMTIGTPTGVSEIHLLLGDRLVRRYITDQLPSAP